MIGRWWSLEYDYLSAQWKRMTQWFNLKQPKWNSHDRVGEILNEMCLMGHILPHPKMWKWVWVSDETQAKWTSLSVINRNLLEMNPNSCCCYLTKKKKELFLLCKTNMDVRKFYLGIHEIRISKYSYGRIGSRPKSLGTEDFHRISDFYIRGREKTWGSHPSVGPTGHFVLSVQNPHFQGFWDLMRGQT